MKQHNLSVQIAGVTLQNPVIAASGTFGYGSEYGELFDVSKLGGICSKGLTFESRPGNEGVRLCETPSGLINSIGLENPGIPHFIAHELSGMIRAARGGDNAGAAVIANLSGSSIDTYVQGAALLDTCCGESHIDMIELNISCPNVKAGGMAFGLDCDAAYEVTRAVRAVTTKPLIVKLSPNAGDLCGIARSVIDAGADALSLVNTFQAIAFDIEKQKPLFVNIKAGLSGPAVKPIALRMVYDVACMIRTLPQSKQVPIIGLGGISVWQDAVEFFLAGASAVQVGTATFTHPSAMLEIIAGIETYMERKGILSVHEMIAKGL